MRSATRSMLLILTSAILWGGCASRDAEPLPPAHDDFGGYHGAEAQLYAEHCALCHGPGGSGDGPAAPWLFPSTRDFGEGRFSIVSTLDGVPSVDDLAGVLERGLPGSAMPSYDWMSVEDREALARFVQQLARQRLAERLVERWSVAGEAMTPKRARELAEFRMTPGAPVVLPEPLLPAPMPTGGEAEAWRARGWQVFLRRCAACHGPEGHGREPNEQWADLGFAWARDLRNGMLQGGGRPEDLARRILAGMPGVGMPPETFADPDDLRALLFWLTGVVGPDAHERGVTRSRTVVAERVEELASATFAELSLVNLMPLRRHPGWIERVSVSAAHDGRELSVRLRWDDATRDAAKGAVSPTGPSDACAVQFAPGDEYPPALFAMGIAEQASEILHWAAYRRRDRLGGLDALDPIGGGRREADIPVFQTPGIAHRADRVHARTPGDREVDEAAAPVEARWQDGTWTVVLRRALPCAVGESLQISVAVWNGSAGETGFRKSVSNWLDLRVQR